MAMNKRLLRASGSVVFGFAGCRGSSCYDPTTEFIVLLGFLAVVLVGFTLTRK
jgi:hypothetical protein